LYAGTGAVGIEALSRGATVVTFVESDTKAVRLMQKNLTICCLLDRADVRVGATKTFLQRTDWWNGPYDILFADPPYAADDQMELLSDAWKPGLLSNHAVMIIEHDSRVDPPPAIRHATLVRRYVYGDTALAVYGPAAMESASS
jgi:16S rRNA (guanine966-N2)-methyltransferase